MSRAPFVIGVAFVVVPLGIAVIAAAGTDVTSAAACGSQSTPMPAGRLGMGGMVRWLEARGITPNGAAGVVGNAQQENGLSPVMNSGGLGLFQWVGARIAAVQAYATAHGLNVESDEAQLGFLIQDLHGPYSGLLARLNAEPSPQRAADDFEAVYERAGIPALANRERYAVQALQQAGAASPVATCGVGTGGYVNPVGRVAGLGPSRVDMGVDYTDTAPSPVLALGDGVIVNTASNGWPGRSFIEERLSSGAYAGKCWYAAENIQPMVTKGQVVQAGQQIGVLYPGYPWSEFGWSICSGGQTLAASLGEQAGGDPGGWTSAAGASANRLLVSLGAPSGVVQSGGPHGPLPSGYP